jgi:hypothetical protein
MQQGMAQHSMTLHLGSRLWLLEGQHLHSAALAARHGLASLWWFCLPYLFQTGVHAANQSIKVVLNHGVLQGSVYEEVTCLPAVAHVSTIDFGVSKVVSLASHWLASVGT